MKKTILLISLTLILPWIVRAETTPLPSDKSCVAYQTKKKMFFFANVTVVGVNCQIQIETEGRSDGQYLKVTIPVDKFDSEDSDRDENVAKIIGGPEKLPLIFEGKFDGKEDLGQDEFLFPGVLRVKGEDFPVTLKMVVEKEQVKFSLETSFSSLKIEVDSVGPGGLIASPQDALTLTGQIRKEIIENL